LPKQQTAASIANTVALLQKRYPPFTPTLQLNEAATIVDMHGRIVVWYLPDILTTERQVGQEKYNIQTSLTEEK
jgi:hypothetical protein